MKLFFSAAPRNEKLWSQTSRYVLCERTQMIPRKVDRGKAEERKTNGKGSSSSWVNVNRTLHMLTANCLGEFRDWAVHYIFVIKAASTLLTGKLLLAENYQLLLFFCTFNTTLSTHGSRSWVCVGGRNGYPCAESSWAKTGKNVSRELFADRMCFRIKADPSPIA